jgi:glycosyltransferase involved in cell wall biosynthesis
VVVLSQSAQVRRLETGRIGALEVWLSPRSRRRDLLTGLRDKWAKQLYGHRKLHSDALDLRDFLARRGPFDLLWAQCEEPDGLVAAMAAQLGVRLPPLLTQIFALRYDFEQNAPRFTEKATLQFAFQRADRLIANSQLVADSLAAYAGEAGVAPLLEKVRVLPPNLERAFLQLEAAGATPEAKRVLFFGALNEKKGALVFLEAVARLAPLDPEASFVVVGGFTEDNPGFERRWNRAVAAARAVIAPEKFELLGRVSRDEAIRQIGRAAVVVAPSLFDEFSRAVVEALLLGRPVVTTRTVGAWPLVAEHNAGEVVPPGDGAALAEAIRAVLQPGRPDAENARRLALRLRSELSPEAIAQQIVRQFEEMVAP